MKKKKKLHILMNINNIQNLKNNLKNFKNQHFFLNQKWMLNIKIKKTKIKI